MGVEVLWHLSCGSKSLIIIHSHSFLKQDKHLENKHTYLFNGFEECQIAAEILVCGYENMIRDDADQEIFAFCVIYKYVTFYRAKIPASYWKKFVVRLPEKQSIVIKRWPEKNRINTFWTSWKKSSD